jgi:hypothetical protein
MNLTKGREYDKGLYQAILTGYSRTFKPWAENPEFPGPASVLLVAC